MVLLNLVLWPLSLQACCSLNEDTVDFWISYVSLELAKITNHLFGCFQKCNRNSGPDFPTSSIPRRADMESFVPSNSVDFV
jgi:hypothetical protein